MALERRLHLHVAIRRYIHGNHERFAELLGEPGEPLDAARSDDLRFHLIHLFFGELVRL